MAVIVLLAALRMYGQRDIKYNGAPAIQRERMTLM